MRHAPPRRRERIGRWLVASIVIAALLAINGPAVISFASSELHKYEINQQSYKEAKGHWPILNVPSKFKINAVPSIFPLPRSLAIAVSQLPPSRPPA